MGDIISAVANRANQAASSAAGVEPKDRGRSEPTKVDAKADGSEWRRMLLDEIGEKRNRDRRATGEGASWTIADAPPVIKSDDEEDKIATKARITRSRRGKHLLASKR